MEKSEKRFDEWTTVDCNECVHWWDNSCDGAKTLGKGSNLRCTSFLATRKVIIPLQIKRLQNDVKWLKIGIVSIAIIDMVFTLLLIFGG